MARETTTSKLDLILLRAKRRLVDAAAIATDSNTYISTIPDELPPNPDEVMFEIAPSHSYQFDQGILAGAGQASLHTQTQLIVTIHSTVQLDEAGRDEIYLTRENLGACELIRQVLKAFCDHDLLDEDDNQMLSHPLMPISGDIPPKDQRERGFVSLRFRCDFDWNMS